MGEQGGKQKGDLSRGEIIFIVIAIAVLGLLSIRLAVLSYDPVEWHLATEGVHDTSRIWNLNEVMHTVRTAIIPLLCGILILISSVLLLGLDVVRAASKRRLRGLVIVAAFGLDAIFYSFVRTEVLYLFFGNRAFFQTLEEVSYILMPVFVTGFFFRGFKLHFPVAMRVIFYVNVAVAFVNLLTYQWWPDNHQSLYFANVIWKLIVIVTLMVMLVFWKRLHPETRQIMMDEGALVCLAISIVAAPLQNMPDFLSWLNVVKMLSVTAYFIFMDVMHTQIILGEYRRSVEQNERALEEQNEKLEVARAEAEEARQDAVAANEAKSRFLANMSHEIRTPINAVLGMDEMILRETRDKDIREYASDIRSAGQTLLSLINEILDFSKIESGKMELAPGEYDFAQIIIDLVNMISVRAQAKDLNFVMEIDPTIPSKMFGDDVRLRQCITNLLTNAVKYTPEGTVYLRASGERVGVDYLLHIEVEDTGIGIKEEDIPKLFQEYERIEESRNRNIEGTGLGMNITLSFLKLMGSELKVKSVYGKGSMFYFDVKQRVLDQTPVGDISTRHAAAEEEYEYGQAFIAPDAHILVTDDNAMNRKVFMSLLKATEIQIDEADSGPAAISLCMEKHYDIIFMDHMMPDMDGIQAMQAIRALPSSPNTGTPIYVLTANAVSGAKEMYIEAGFDGFLSKPVVSDKIEEVLKERLPKELMKPAPEGQGMGGDETAAPSGPPQDLPAVDGLDWNFAWLHLPGEEMLEDSVKQFYDLIEVHADKLADFYAGLPDENALDNYRIQVHGMKSSAATIGIVPLAGMAKILEFAAKDNRQDIITATHPVFIDEWRTYLDKLNGVFGIVKPDNTQDESLPMADYGMTLAYLEMIRVAMDDFDVDKADEIMEKLKEFRYPDEVSDLIKKIGGAVADLDNDKVTELVEKVGGIDEWQA